MQTEMNQPVINLPAETIHLPVALTDRRRLELAQEMAKNQDDAERTTAELKRINESNKERIKEFQTRVSAIASVLNVGREVLPVTCQRRVDLTHNKMVTVRLDTEEPVAERPLSPQERADYLKRKPAHDGR